MENTGCYRPYVAVIGDIRGSREIAERNSVQGRLREVLCRINETYRTEIAAKFVITLGDEFQGLLHGGLRLVEIMEEIERGMYPVRIRFGIGIGEITTEINAEMAIGADGPAYYRAREAVERLKDSEQRKKLEASDIRIEIERDEHSQARALNTIFLLMTVLKGHWSGRQREIIWQFEENRGSQAACAEQLQISQSSVQRSLANGNYYAYKEARDTVSSVMGKIGEVRV